MFPPCSENNMRNTNINTICSNKKRLASSNVSEEFKNWLNLKVSIPAILVFVGQAITKMKIFKLNQQFLGEIGIVQQKSSRFNTTILRCILVYGVGVISCGYFFFYQADTFIDRTFSVFLLCTMTISIFGYTYMVCVMPNFFEFIASVERILQCSE